MNLKVTWLIAEDILSNSLDIWEGDFGTLLAGEFVLSTKLDHQT